jgi:L-lactate dehydrogenase (cytochrome)
MTGVGEVDLSTELFGQKLSLPVALAPVGLAGLNARRGEVQAARAAERAGVPFTLSTVSACTMEEVQRGTTKPFWFQLYMIHDRGFMREMLARARAAGCTTLLFTVDMPIPGIRYRDMRSGLSAGTAFSRKLKQITQVMARPAWAWDVGVMGRPHTLGHVASVLKDKAGVDQFWSWMGRNFDPTVTWKDIEAVRAEWNGPLVIKGVLDAEDARAAADAGADGLIVSNHGGRQLDGVPSAIHALPAIADAVGDRMTVLMDGGVRSGLDVVRAVASGARAVLIGRPWVYGLAARGEAGVSHVLDILAKEMRVAMALTGASRVTDLKRENLI